MKVLMFGWEFPPYKGGGLATACHDLTKGLSKLGVDVTFVMPHADETAEAEFVKIPASIRKRAIAIFSLIIVSF